MENALFALRLETHRAAAPGVEATLEAESEPFSVWCDEVNDYVKFECFFPCREDADAVAKRLAPHIETPAGEESCVASVLPVPREDWSESWKAHFRVEQVSQRLVVKPSWEQYSPSGNEVVIELDPGMSFGTGQHATTRACLRFIDRLARERPDATFLDLGCGSGILSIAAARLGLRNVTAVDIDPDAVRIARENCATNGVDDRVRCSVGALATWRPEQAYDVVAANILAGVLCKFAAMVGGCAAPGGHLVLAGIMRDQYPGVKERFAEIGFREADVLGEEEWQSGLFEDGRK